MSNRLTDWYDSLRPEAKKRIWKSVFFGAVVMVAVICIYLRQGQMKPLGAEKKEPAKKSVNISNKLLEMTITSENEETRKRVAELERQNAENAKNGANPAAAAMTNRTTGRVPKATLTQTIDSVIAAKQNPGKGAFTLAPTPAPRQNQPTTPTPTHTPMPAQPSPAGTKTKFSAPPPPTEAGEYYQDAKAVKWGYGGKIDPKDNADAAKNPSTDTGAKADGSEPKKKAKKIVHLPVGFMAARTLNGLLVPATSDGKGDPYPVMIRVSTPAVLPNGISAQLSGCFFVTEAIGSLQQSRALVRIVSLTCLGKRGEAVIEADVRGFVEDSDGKPGLAGIVAAPKFGEIVRLSALAGFLSGVGDGMSLSSASNTMSAVGPLTSYGTTAQDIGIAAAGKGISNATKKINEVYGDLLHQSLPVVEVGNGKKITVWVTKGVDLEIKNYKNFEWY